MAKEITPLNFIKIGIARALDRSVLTRTRYGKNWIFESDAVLHQLLDLLMHHFDQGGFGPYNAFRHVFGKKLAEDVGKGGQYPVPG